MNSADRLLQRRAGEVRGLASVRLFLVLATVVIQSVEVSESFARFDASPLWILSVATIPALFALLGFNLALAAERRSLPDFLRRRAVFALPPMALAVFGASLVIGPIAATTGLRRYFADAEFWAYHLNLIGLPRFTLPGVFEFNNSADTVNAVQWTVPLTALLVITLALVLRLPRWRTPAAAVLAIAVALFGFALPPSGSVLTSSMCFLLATLAALERARLPIDWRIAAVAALPVVALALAGDATWIDTTIGALPLAVAITYLTVFAALSGFTTGPIARISHRYLIGVFLFSYPIQQLIVVVGPPRQSTFVNLILSLPIIVALAIAAWHLVQKPIAAYLLGTEFSETTAFGTGRPVAQMVRFARASAPVIVTSLVIALIALAVMAMVLFALQRDAVGV